jgi:hypothetical protein
MCDFDFQEIDHWMGKLVYFEYEHKNINTLTANTANEIGALMWAKNNEIAKELDLEQIEIEQELYDED